MASQLTAADEAPRPRSRHGYTILEFPVSSPLFPNSTVLTRIQGHDSTVDAILDLARRVDNNERKQCTESKDIEKIKHDIAKAKDDIDRIYAKLREISRTLAEKVETIVKGLIEKSEE